ncbi:hypothetical protein [Kitasatospora sp. NPDC048538]|uniref:hypothetical protein n=1 Tax=unclassified Kitasatospora TaxID=2633591 RepID=UPI0033E282F9
MTVLHSRNADAADPADVAAADVKDPQDAKATTAEPDLREDLGRYAELGAFTLTADTHAWYAAVDTVATPEDARAGSTALAELRGHDLQQTWDDVTALASEAKLDEPDTVAKTVLLVELLQRVHRTAATLHRAAYDADLGALAAATADGAWRRENGVKLSWLRARSLRKQATALATDRRVRREDLHEALTSAEIERRAWAALAPSGTLPAAPADGALVERTAQTFESINTGLRELARLLPGHDLDGLAFAGLIDLVDRLAADEGTLYRLPTIRGLRATLEDAGLADLLSELAATRADRYAAEAAYAARQALAGGQRDGLAGGTAAGTVESDTAGSEVAGSEVVESVESAEPETAESSTAPVTVEEPSTDVVSEVATEADAEAEIETEAEAEVAAETVAVEAEPSEETDVHEAVAEEEVTVEAQPVVVTLPAPSPAADDLVAAATAALAEAPDVPETLEESETAEPVATDEPVEEAVEEASEVEAVAEAPAVEEPVVVASEPVVEAEAVAEPEAVEETVDPVEEAEPVAEAEAEVAEAPAAEAEVTEQPVVVETVEAEVVTEVATEAEVATETEVVDETVEPVAVEEAEAEVAAEPVVVETVEAEVVTEVATEAEVAAEVEVVDETVEPVAVEEPEVEVVEVETETPAAVVEEAAEPVALEEPAVREQAAEPVKEPEPELEPEPAPGAAGRPAKPDFTPGRPVTAYSADELLAVVRWVDGDGETRSEEELLRAAMKELGFARLGPRIKEALGAAVTAARG